MTEGNCPRLDVGEIPLLKDIKCIIKGTKNVAESSDDKGLNRSPLGIAMNIDSDLTTHPKNKDRYVVQNKNKSISNMFRLSSCMFEHTLMNCHDTALQVKYESPIETHLWHSTAKKTNGKQRKSLVGSPTPKRDGKS
jgi:hypothetical protein